MMLVPRGDGRKLRRLVCVRRKAGCRVPNRGASRAFEQEAERRLDVQGLSRLGVAALASANWSKEAASTIPTALAPAESQHRLNYNDEPDRT
jgi:hypothetical protein